MKKLKEEKMVSKTPKRRKFKEGHWELTLMLLPALLLIFIFCYMPMPGIVVAFKNLRFNLGIWGSDWNGLDNFGFLFKSNSIWTLLRNTIGYNVAKIILSNIIPIILALCMEKVRSKKYLIKTYQTGMFMPYFLSWIVVSYFTYALFDYNTGIINSVLEHFGADKVAFYRDPSYWPFILIFFSVWKGLGYQTLVYYGSLLSIDLELYDAAAIDGCSYLQRVRYISLPHLVPSIIILILLSLGGIFRSDYGLFYFIPQDQGALIKTTDVLDTYILRTLRDATNLGLSSAMSFLQSVVGFIFVIVGNTIAKKIDPDSALF